jgi:hemoglobin
VSVPDFAPPNPHFDRIGGAAAVDRLVEVFYQRMDSLPQAATIRAMHDADLAPLKQVLKLYLTEWLGGPRGYSAQRGHPRLRLRHAPFAIGAAERDAWMDCMRAALQETVQDAALRDQIERAFARVAETVRNQPG